MIPETEVLDLVTRFSDVVTEHGSLKPEIYGKSLAWWQGGGDLEAYFEQVPDRPWCRPTPAADWFAELVHHANPDTDKAQELWDNCLGFMSGDSTDSVFVAASRKASPIAALCYGLGAAGICLLPGRFGTFLLPNAEVSAALPLADQALGLTGDR